jgi:CHAT domain-containing protein
VQDFDELPFVQSELAAIVRENDTDLLGIYPGLKLLNGDFNRQALIDNLVGYRIIHIATHGQFVPGLPEASFLLLGDGDTFSIPDINSLGSDLRDVHLVVLSACETAVGGPDADGIEVAGISSYFLAANRASAVLASLWLVNDASTSLLMQQFYENLAQGTMTKAAAMQQAQLALLNGELDPALVEALSRSIVGWGEEVGATDDESIDDSPDISHPYYWAPFILIGNGL